MRSSSFGRLHFERDQMPADLASVRRKMDLGLVFLAFPSEITLEVLALPR
jgi:hypothetical protein